MFRSLRIDKIFSSQKKRGAFVLYALGVGFFFLMLFSSYPHLFINHLGKFYALSKEKLSKIEWIGLQGFGAASSESDHLAILAVAPELLTDPEPLPSNTSKWSWPSFSNFKSAPLAANSKPYNPQQVYSERVWYPYPQRVTLSHIEGDNFTNCFATNLTKGQVLFAGQYVPGQFLPQFDFRGIRFDDTTYAVSGGVVLRYIPKHDGPVNQILGINAYYDYRQGNIGFFNQVGGGVEILGNRWDFRANVYVPFSGKRKMANCAINDSSRDFFAVENSLESISFAYNAEVGWLAVNSQYLLIYLAGGPYYIAGKKYSDKTRGGEFRIQPQYKDFVALNAIFSYDPFFNAVYQFEMIVHLPLYLLSKKIDKKDTCGLTSRQIYQPVVRYDVMPMGHCTCGMFN